jgi:hypothetical protein
LNKLRSVALVLIVCLITGCSSPAKSTVQSLPAASRASRARLLFDQGGYYQLSSARLKEAGLFVGGVDQIRFLYKDGTIPFWYKADSQSKEEFTLYFLVPHISDHSLSQQVMIIETNAEAGSNFLDETIQLEESRCSAAEVFAETVSIIEDNALYLPKAGSADPFMWAKITSAETSMFSLPADEEISGQAALNLYFWSSSTAPQKADHGVVISESKTELGTFEWKGAGRHNQEISVTLDQKAGPLELGILAHNPDGVLAQDLYLDRIELRGNKPLSTDDFLPGVLGKGADLNFGSAVTDGFLVETDQAGFPQEYAETEQGSRVCFQSESGARYDWVPLPAFSEELDLTILAEHSSIFPDRQVDWLVIASQKFENSLAPLLSLRQNQGISTFVLDPQQLYDELSGGYPGALALQTYFRQYEQTLNSLPKYVLLVGDYSYEKMDYLSSIQFLPSVWIADQAIGETVSDFPIMDINADNQADFIIGRIPAQSPQELENWIDKVIVTETVWTSNSERELLVVSDDQEAGFLDDAASFSQEFQPPYTIVSLQKPAEDSYLDEINKCLGQDPVTIVSYFGHGSIDTWGKDQILTAEDIPALKGQECFPIFVNITCLTGYYVHPDIVSLTERLLFEKKAGASAVLASTSLTSTVEQTNLRINLANALQFKADLRLGDVLLATWEKMESNPDTYDASMQTFNLFGDPAMILFP